MTRTTPARPPLLERIRATLAEPVLRALTVATLISTVGRGITLTLVVLYLTIIVGLPADQVALVFTVGAAVSVLFSYLGGHLADRVSARRLLIGCVVLTGLALASFVLVTELWQAILAEVAASIGMSANGAVRAAIIAHAFVGQGRVTSRAVLRTVTNIGITIGSGVAAIALALGTPEAYRAILLVGGTAYALCALALLRLPARVDGPAEGEADAAEPAPVGAGRSPWRDRRYLLFSAFAAVFAIQFAVTNVGIPLWLVHDTVAPEWLLSIMLIANTVLVIALQVPLSRGTHDLRRAGTVTAVSGVLMALACAAYGGAGGAGLALAVVLLLAGTVLHALAEILSQAGAWGLSFELADPASAGAYQGVYAMGFSLAGLAAPLVIAVTALEHGLAGWLLLGAMFLVSAVGVTGVAYRSAAQLSSRRDPAASTP
ncbi:MFS transporter [Protaetiibacter intestinalis]|uniref:MFS transporter n=1 Tax=Protaetiibacter intestinalis TaxID=2419774 RepID=A0A387B3I6_9MICO|nr:MFS transporter [Protaetiibacter intestinalis]AYF96983.1 MFS transporter [Protaetiibacter intestinalis]